MFIYSFIQYIYYLSWKILRIKAEIFFGVEFTDGSPDQATAYQKEKMKKEMSKRMSGNVNSMIHKHEHAYNIAIMHIIYLIYIP